MLAVLEIKNIGVNPSGEKQIKGYAVFSQSEKGGFKESKIALSAKGAIAEELANYTRGIATGYLRFVKHETDAGNKITRVSLVVENFSPLPDAPNSNPTSSAESKTTKVDEEIPF